jgi:hypothetical protein
MTATQTLPQYPPDLTCVLCGFTGPPTDFTPHPETNTHPTQGLCTICNARHTAKQKKRHRKTA